jgi:hypothetical protein
MPDAIRNSNEVPLPIHDRNKHNYWFLASFSFVSTVILLLPISRELHNTFYSANVFALIGFTIIMFLYPSRLYNLYGETIRHIIDQLGLSRMIQLNMYSFNAGSWIIHVIPVWAFRNSYSLGELTIWLLAYFVLAGPFLERIYNLTFLEIAGVALATSGVFVVTTSKHLSAFKI